MKGAFFTILPGFAGGSAATRKVVEDMAKLSETMDMEIICVPHNKRFLLILPGLLRSMRADFVVIPYPVLGNPVFNTFWKHLSKSLQILLLHLLSRIKPVVLYVLDLPVERYVLRRKIGNNVSVVRKMTRKYRSLENILLRNVRVICVFNSNMAETLINSYGLRPDKFVEFEMLDYITDFIPPRKKTLGRIRKVVWAGNLDKDYLGTWIVELPVVQNVRYVFYGLNGKWLQGLGRPDFVYAGFKYGESFIEAISQADFGLINMASSGWIEYIKYGSTTKFSAYVVAGLPVLVPSNAGYLAHLVEKYGVGLVFDSVEDIPKIVSGISPQDYLYMRDNCLVLGEKIRAGFFYKRAIKSALRLINSSQ